MQITINQELTSLIAICVALLSFLLAAYSLYLQRRDKKAKLTVKSRTALPIHSGGWFGDIQEYISIEAGNSGHINITISSCGLEMPSGKVMIITRQDFGTKLPYELMPGQASSHFILRQDVIRTLHGEGYRGVVSLRPIVADQLDRKYRGKKIRVTI